jgi:hypothetical protein
MTISIADLRKSRTADFTKITQALTKTNDRQDDGDYFKLTKDKVGNGSATIRFLPKHPDDELPFVTIYSHAFQGPTGRWYIENSRSTINETDPISELNRSLWASGLESDKELARKQKRKTTYISNILVINDPGNPDNNGKIMRFKYGKKIFQMIMDKANPTFAEDQPVNVFDPFDGADFKLRMRQVEGYPNYDTSVFGDSKPIGNDDYILDVVNQMKPLNELIAPNQFKSYDELKKKYDSVMNAKPASIKTAEEVVERMRDETVSTQKPVGVEKTEPVKVQSKPDPAPWVETEEDDIEAYFAKIAS